MPCGKPVEKLAPPPKIQSGLTTSPPFPTSLHDFPHTSPTLPPLPPHFTYSQNVGEAHKSLCAKALYTSPPPLPQHPLYSPPLFFLSSSSLFFFTHKKREMLGKLGKSVSNSLSPSRLWLPPHFFQCGEVGESWGKLGVCGGEVGSVCGGGGEVGWGCRAKKIPPDFGGRWLLCLQRRCKVTA